MTFTESMVDDRLAVADLDTSGTEGEKRERLAVYIEDKYGDHVEAWEIRTGRPWNEMTSNEAYELIDKHPTMLYNPGVVSRLVSRF